MTEQDASGLMPPQLSEKYLQIGRRAREIQVNSAEYLILCGIKPPLIPDAQKLPAKPRQVTPGERRK
jgi:hypothetical protein